MQHTSSSSATSLHFGLPAAASAAGSPSALPSAPTSARAPPGMAALSQSPYATPQRDLLASAVGQTPDKQHSVDPSAPHPAVVERLKNTGTSSSKRKRSSTPVVSTGMDCMICGGVDHQDRIVFCDHCSGVLHMDCLNPPLEHVPHAAFFCYSCAEVMRAEERPKVQTSVDALLNMASQAASTSSSDVALSQSSSSSADSSHPQAPIANPNSQAPIQPLTVAAVVRDPSSVSVANKLTQKKTKKPKVDANGLQVPTASNTATGTSRVDHDANSTHINQPRMSTTAHGLFVPPGVCSPSVGSTTQVHPIGSNSHSGVATPAPGSNVSTPLHNRGITGSSTMGPTDSTMSQVNLNLTAPFPPPLGVLPNVAGLTPADMAHWVAANGFASLAEQRVKVFKDLLDKSTDVFLVKQWIQDNLSALPFFPPGTSAQLLSCFERTKMLLCEGLKQAAMDPDKTQTLEVWANAIKSLRETAQKCGCSI
jgi:hypothetical protein